MWELEFMNEQYPEVDCDPCMGCMCLLVEECKACPSYSGQHEEDPLDHHVEFTVPNFFDVAFYEKPVVFGLKRPEHHMDVPF